MSETPGGSGPESARARSHRDLTPRQQAVLAALCEGRSNPEIAASLGMGRSTVERHLSEIYVKLGVRSRTAAIAWSFRDRRETPLDRVNEWGE